MKRQKSDDATMESMRWPAPAVGSRRKVKRFALLPTMMDCGVMVWLEWYFSHEEFCHHWDGVKWVPWKKEPIPKSIIKD